MPTIKSGGTATVSNTPKKKKGYFPFRIHKSKNNLQFWFTIVSKNGNVIATSETYKRKGSAIKGINAIEYLCDDIMASNKLMSDYIEDLTIERKILPKKKAKQTGETDGLESWGID